MTAVGEGAILVHDAHADNPDLAFALSRLADTSLARTAIGVFRAVQRPTYDELMTGQVEAASRAAPADLDELLRGKDTWTVTI